MLVTWVVVVLAPSDLKKSRAIARAPPEWMWRTTDLHGRDIVREGSENRESLFLRNTFDYRRPLEICRALDVVTS